MKYFKKLSILTIVTLLFLFGVMPAVADYRQQCPPDTDGIDTDGDGIIDNDNVCFQVGSGDGFTTMADGKSQYIFGFSDHGGLYRPGDPIPDPLEMGNMWDDPVAPGNILGANYPAPSIDLREGQKLFLNLSNVGMLMRPDLFDPHTVHYHGFANVAGVMDGVPDSGISINMGSTLTYFYNIVDPGTFLYHCHVEATEHMQMGMMGNLYVRPMQETVRTRALNPLAPISYQGKNYTKFAHNDIVDPGNPGGNPLDGATGYDVAYPIQLTAFDPDFHDASILVQPLPFADMHDRYPMLNGRGYPDTINTGNITNPEGFDSQTLSALIEATQGDRILLRFNNVSIERFFTITSLGIPMQMVGMDSRILRGGGVASGLDLSYKTNSFTTGGGETREVILDTTDVAPGTYFLYATDLDQLSNDQEDFGGVMTEIVISAAGG